MTSSEAVLSQYIDDWNAGLRPRVEDYLARVDAAERDELAEQIAAWASWAPSPDHTPEALAEIRSEPVLAQVRAASDREGGLWSVVLPRLRARAGLGLADLAQRVHGALGLSGGSEEKTARYLEDMETDRLDPRGVSQRVLDALAAALGTSGRDLAEAGDLGSGARPAMAFYRDRPMDLDVLHDLADAAHEPAPEDFDEVDELFRGGR
jgi:hypothetical protein